MNTHSPLSLAAWKLASRHQGIEAFAAGLLPVLQAVLPLRHVLIRRLDAARSALETVASAGPGASASGHRSAFDAVAWQTLLEDCRRGAWWHDTAASLLARMPGRVPDGVHGEVFAFGLATDGSPAGLAVLALDPGAAEAEFVALAHTLSEPLAVALENDRHLRELSALREAAEAERRSLLKRLGRQDIADTIVGAQSGLQEVMERVDLVARSDTPVLILGETGTGKEVVARAIHRRSSRAGGPFLRVNCGALPQELIDSELFGHERGSFTGAVASRKGWFERADGGTLLLDEVGELTPGCAGAPAARAAGRQRPARRRPADADGGRARGRRHQPRPAGHGRGRQLPRGPLVSHRGVSDPPARAARAAAGHPRHRHPFRAARRRASGRRAADPERSGSGAARRLSLARAMCASWPRSSSARRFSATAIAWRWPRRWAAANLGRVRLPTRLRRRQADAAQNESLDAVMRRHIESALIRSHGRIEGPFGVAASLGINPHTLRARMRKLGIEPRAFRKT